MAAEPGGSQQDLALRRDLLWLRKGLGLADLTKYARVSSDFRHVVADVRPGATNFEGRATEHMLRLLADLPEEVRETSFAEFNAHTDIVGRDLTYRQGELASKRGVSSKTIIREGNVALAFLAAALKAKSPGFAQLPKTRLLHLPRTTTVLVEPPPVAEPPLPQRKPASTRRELRNVASESLQMILRWAEDIQNDDGGLPADCKGAASGTWTTAGLLWALAEAGMAPDTSWAMRSLNWIIDNINSDCGVPIMRKGDPSVTDATAQTALALATAYEATRDDYLLTQLESVARWLISKRIPAAGWPWRPDVEGRTCWIAPTAFATLALSRVGDVLADSRIGVQARLAVTEVQAWLIGCRNSDGGWPSKPGEQSCVSQTGLACYTLDRVGSASLSIDTPTRFLHRVKKYSDSIDRPAGSTVIRWADPYRSLGLASQGDSDQHLVVAVRTLLKSFDKDHFVYRDTSMQTWPTRDGVLALSRFLARPALSAKA